MQSSQRKILLICEHDGVLLKYTEILNVLGLFWIVTCNSFHEARRLMARNGQFDYLFYDGFSGSRWYDLLVFRDNIKNIVLFAELGEAQRLIALRWAQQEGISRLAILPRPVMPHHIHEVITFPGNNKVSVEIADRRGGEYDPVAADAV